MSLTSDSPRRRAGTNGKQACADELRAGILTRVIAPGSDLDETELANHYGLSRTPLREVLQLLSGEGFITLQPNRGARVSSMDFAVMRSFFQTAPLIYATAARLAAKNRSTEQLGELKATQGVFRKAIQMGDGAEAALNNHRFHALIGEMAHNAYLMPSLNRLLIDHTRLGQTFYHPESGTERMLVLKAADQHDAMIAAIEDRNAEDAAELTLQHWDLSRDRMARYVQPDPLPLQTTDITRNRSDAI
ncbi:MAG: GntR family transcriptional regulator [Pseudomonadota bacterium]